MSDYEGIAKLLNEPIDRADVRTRKGGGGRDLSYIDGYYVFSEMNRIFGNMRWGYYVNSLEVVSEIAGEKHSVCYRALVSLSVDIPGGDGSHTINDVGFGHGLDRSPGQAHESAGKEAVTDAVKRCARALGNRLGLALYDKEQANVREEPEKPTRGKKAKAEHMVAINAAAQVLETAIRAATTIEDLERVKPSILEFGRAGDEDERAALYEGLKRIYKEVELPKKETK